MPVNFGRKAIAPEGTKKNKSMAAVRGGSQKRGPSKKRGRINKLPPAYETKVYHSFLLSG